MDRRNSTDEQRSPSGDAGDVAPDGTDEPLPDDVHWVLTDRYRRSTLAALDDRESATLTELAGDVAETADASAERLRVSLDRHHLPVMVEAGLVEYDADSEEVALAKLSERTRDRIDRAIREK